MSQSNNAAGEIASSLDGTSGIRGFVVPIIYANFELIDGVVAWCYIGGIGLLAGRISLEL